MFTFKELTPIKTMTTEDTSNIVRVSFNTRRNSRKEVIGNAALIYLGKGIAQKIGINEGDRVKLSVDTINPRVWLLQKATNDIGYKVLDVKRPGTQQVKSYRIQLTWREFVPTQDERTTREAKFDHYAGGIRIYLK